MMHRIRYEVTRMHTRCRWFVGPEDGTLAKAGELVFRNGIEFNAFKQKMEDAGIDLIADADVAAAWAMPHE